MWQHPKRFIPFYKAHIRPFIDLTAPTRVPLGYYEYKEKSEVVGMHGKRRTGRESTLRRITTLDIMLWFYSVKLRQNFTKKQNSSKYAARIVICSYATRMYNKDSDHEDLIVAFKYLRENSRRQTESITGLKNSRRKFRIIVRSPSNTPSRFILFKWYHILQRFWIIIVILILILIPILFIFAFLIHGVIPSPSYLFSIEGDVWRIETVESDSRSWIRKRHSYFGALIESIRVACGFAYNINIGTINELQFRHNIWKRDLYAHHKDMKMSTDWINIKNNNNNNQTVISRHCLIRKWLNLDAAMTTLESLHCSI